MFLDVFLTSYPTNTKNLGPLCFGNFYRYIRTGAGISIWNLANCQSSCRHSSEFHGGSFWPVNSHWGKSTGNLWATIYGKLISILPARPYTKLFVVFKPCESLKYSNANSFAQLVLRIFWQFLKMYNVEVSRVLIWDFEIRYSVLSSVYSALFDIFLFILSRIMNRQAQHQWDVSQTFPARGLLNRFEQCPWKIFLRNSEKIILTNHLRWRK